MEMLQLKSSPTMRMFISTFHKPGWVHIFTTQNYWVKLLGIFGRCNWLWTSEEKGDFHHKNQLKDGKFGFQAIFQNGNSSDTWHLGLAPIIAVGFLRWQAPEFLAEKSWSPFWFRTKQWTRASGRLAVSSRMSGWINSLVELLLQFSIL